ncbi:MAG TPA: ankyrin repeat domain-containing protein [Polyangiaceae bacterium]|nr:ankyrin repeat domain-containing protein [Polyangiaceae bacterium]
MARRRERLDVDFPCDSFELWSRAQWRNDGDKRPAAITPKMVVTCIDHATAAGWPERSHVHSVSNGWELFPLAPLWQGIVDKDHDGVRKLLEAGADPKGTSCGITVIAFATVVGDETALAALLAHGADPNATSLWNPLCVAVRTKRRDLYDQLLAAGADPTLREGYRGTALEEAAQLKFEVGVANPVPPATLLFKG